MKSPGFVLNYRVSKMTQSSWEKSPHSTTEYCNDIATHSKANKLAHVWCTMPHKCFRIILEAITCTSPLAMQAYVAKPHELMLLVQSLMLPLY